MLIARNNAPLRIAYIEDNEEDAKSLLQSWKDYRPRLQTPLDWYSTGTEYLKQIAGPFPVWHDIILLDLHLPDVESPLGGLQVAKILKSQPELASQSIMIVTASDAQTAQAAQELVHAEGWAVKPIRAAGILQAIGEINREQPWYGIELIRLRGDDV